MEFTEALYFRNQFRAARAKAYEDAEGFQGVLFCLEGMGIHLSERVENLDKYKMRLAQIAEGSPLARDVPNEHGSWHASFDSLYEALRLARNDAVHQGAYARTLTSHAMELALIFEDALMSEATQVSHFMVRDPICAKAWQPVSFVRQQMLIHSFTYLPIYWDRSKSWRLVSEHVVARFLRGAGSGEDRKRRLASSLKDVADTHNFPLLDALTAVPNARIESILNSISERPILVVNGEGPDSLVGILAASDIL